MRHRRRRKGKTDWLDLIFLLGIIAVFVHSSGDPSYLALFQAIVGFILFLLLAKYLAYRKKMRPLHISGVDDMSGTEFEHFIAKLLRKQGYQVQEIGGFEDYGIDLIASRGEQKYAVQAKRWSSEVGVDAVRAAVTGVKYHGCTKAVVITNNYFSQRAIALADVNDCKLINRDELASEIRKAA